LAYTWRSTALHHPAERAHGQRRESSDHQKLSPSGHLVAEVGAQQVEGAVREIHEAQQAEDDRQAHGQQEVQHADADAVDDLQQIDVHGTS
jgi:hypothetical protein